MGKNKIKIIAIEDELILSILWESKPFPKPQAYFDLMLNSAEKETMVLFRNSRYKIDKGQQITSDNDLRNRWGWSRTKVREFISVLQEFNYIKVDRNKKRTIITICNYDIYFNSEISKNTSESNNTKQESEHQTLQVSKHSKTLENNELIIKELPERIHVKKQKQATSH